MNSNRTILALPSFIGLALLVGLVIHGIPCSACAATPRAEVKEVRLAKQYGLGYLPLIVLEEKRLIETHARAAGLGDIKTTWTTLTGGAAATDAILSGSVDYISTGVTPLVTLWSKTGGEVKGVAALDATPILLNTVNPTVKSLKDFTAADRIALPAVKVSIQAVVLQLAAAREFGQSNYAKLDPLTVTMKHPDALTALLSGRSEITAHLATPPFMFQELKDARVRTVLNSFDVLGGPHTCNVLSTTKSFRDRNPKTYVAVLAALEEAVAFIETDKQAAAEIYLKSSKSKETLDEVLAQLNHPLFRFTTTPLNTTKFSDFQFRIGAIAHRPANWRELFFAEIFDKPGS
jgi:NitT/TauT family transport system substrate-binding protein